MRLLPDGPSIPDELVALQEKGDTIFICGAGVSLTAGLPTFRGLVQRIYDELGEQWSLHPAEREVMDKRGRLANQYDRVLRILEKRLAASDLPKSRSMRERIRTTIRRALSPPAGAHLENHSALLNLSRDDEGRCRLITTNFDTLFERAWFDQHGECVASHAGPAMPQPKVSSFAGVLHLHGRLADNCPECALTETDLVLTSAEFGDAYLRSGWASRYVYDVVRAHTVVLVGYEADDPPMRYLLEVLEADRERYTDLHRVYAFASCKSGEEDLVTALWRAKGVEPILYRPDKLNHDRLYKSLREWKRYADDATAWRRDKLRPILARSPKRMAQATLDKGTSLLRHGDASQLLGELSPSAKWMTTLIERRLFASGHERPGEWIAARIDDADMIRASTALPSIDDQLRWLIERAMEQARTTLSPVRRTAWNLILKSKRHGRHDELDFSWYQNEKYIEQGEAGHENRQLVRRILQPQLEISKPWRLEPVIKVRSRPTLEMLSDFMRITFSSESQPTSKEILEAWPHKLDQELALFRVLDRAIAEALEEADEIGFLDGWDSASADIPSVAPHSQNAHHRGFYPIVRTLADLWTRIAATDQIAARSALSGWEKSSYLLVRRMHLFALCERSVFAASEAFSALHGLKDAVFWASDAQVEIMRLATTRGQEFEDSDRRLFEARIRLGIPRTLFDARAFDDDEKWSAVKDSAVMNRLCRLKAAGWQLMGESQALLDEIAQRHPKWAPSPADRDDFNVWHETKSSADRQPELLTNVADAELVAEAMRLQQERSFYQRDIWRAFSAADPERALRGLQSEARIGRWNADAWRDLIWAASEKGDLSLQSELTEAVISAPDETLAKVLVAAAQWLQRRRELLAGSAHSGAPFIRVWDRLVEVTFLPDAAPAYEHDIDLSGRAFGEPAGILAAVLLEHLAAPNPPEGAGFEPQMTDRLTRVAEAAGGPGLLARVALIRNLAFLDRIAADWTVEHLVPCLSWKRPEAAAMWRARSADRVGSSRLFNAVKPDLLKAFEQPVMSDHDLEGPLCWLISIALSHRQKDALDYKIESTEIKRALAAGTPGLRSRMAWHFYQLMAGTDIQPNDKTNRWRDKVGPIFREIWPLDAQLRDKDSSRNLIQMLLECDGAFGEAVNAVADLLVPFQIDRLKHTLRLRPHHEALVRQHPRPALRLASALTDPNLCPPPTDLAEFLQLCLESDASMASEPAYVRLHALSRRQSA